ncbi:Bcr/CflA family multidrug efflux MFS transporter [Ferrimonas kyonanensis]|uniref:Bcr/CflA family multidrug efflux MFS transporter n=1 Tax=Ferrimonas kyonanensis TaxID=364763 RepID=UPI0003F911B9|nr:Bcr/CflA family multidrug efflux MFS transporter [Ferrimonas kyonanensis]
MTQTSKTTGLALIVLLGALAGMTPLAIDMYLPAIPAIADELHATVSLTQMSVSFFLVGFAVGQLFYGPVTDALGRIPVLIGGLGVFALASILATFTSSVEGLIAARVLQALGGAGGSVVVMAILRDLFQREQFARAMSFVMLVMNLAPLAAPIVGGYLLAHSGWRAIFYLLALLSLLLVVLIATRIGETLPASKRHRLNLSSALGLYRRIILTRQTMMYLGIGALVSGSLFVFITGSSYVYIRYFDVAPEHFGYLFGLNIILMMLLTSFNARYVARFGTLKMLATGLSISGVGAVLALLAASLSAPPLWLVVLPVMLMVGPLGMVSANATSLSLDSFDGAAGSVSALGGAIRFISGALSGVLLSLSHPQSPMPMLIGMAVCSLAALGYYWYTLNVVPKAVKDKK